MAGPAHPGPQVHGHDELVREDASLAPEPGARAGGQQESIAAGRAPVSDAVRIAREYRAPERLVGDGARPAAEDGRGGLADVARHAFDVRRQHPVDGRQQVAVRRADRRGQEVAFGEERTGAGRLRRPARGEQQPGEPRVQRQPAKLAPEGRKPAPRVDGPKLTQQVERTIERARRRRLEPLERARIVAPDQHVQRRCGQIRSRNVRHAVWPQPIARVPQPDRAARRDTAGPASTLIGGVGRHALDLEAVDAAVRVVARDLLEPGVDDRAHIGHRQRRLGDVRGENDPRPPRGRQRGILRLGVEPAVQGHDRHAPASPGGDPRGSLVDLGRARQERQHGAAGLRQQLGHRILDRHARAVDDLDGKLPPLHRDDGRVAQKRGDARRIDRRRHDHEPEIGARQPGLPRERQTHVGVNAALVELVDDDGPERGEQGILLQPGGEDAFGRDQQPGLGGEPPVETDVPPHLSAHGPALLDGDASCDGPRRHPPWLQQEDRTVGGERRRYSRRLARPGGGSDDHGPRPADAGDDLVEASVDGQEITEPSGCHPSQE